MLKDLLLQTRSFRRFYEDERLDADVLTAAIDAARLCPSARNAQPLKYRLVTERDECDRLFPTLRWAAYLKDWGGPAEGARPAAYLIQLLDTRIVRDPYCDDGTSRLSPSCSRSPSAAWADASSRPLMPNRFRPTSACLTFSRCAPC